MAGDRRRTLYPLDPSSYRILGEIGSGASAVVYKAVCLPLGSVVVAIKSIDLDRSRPKLDDARREATAMTLLSHPNILASHCSFTVGRRLWVVMPLMAAGSLRSVISSSFPDGLPEAPVAVVLREVLCALSYLHGQGHVHRDIKAGNILLDSDGSVKLADFGVSASIYDHSSSSASSSTSFKDMAGTPYWMAPEVIRSHDGYGVKADIWSFGVTALELAHGRPPLSHLPLWKSLVIRIANHLQNDDRKKKKKLSKTFKDMVSSCLAHDPTKRPSADHLLRHPFFKNCKTTDYLVKNVLHVVPSVVEMLKEEVMPACCDDAGASSPPDAKIRRISGWNFNEEKHKHRRVSFGGEEIIHKEVVHRGDEDVTKESVGHDKSPPALKETLVPSLVSLLSSLEVQRAMVMDVLTHCGGGEDGVHDLRERQLLGFVLTLQRVVDDLDIQLQREKKRNQYLEEVVNSLAVKNA